MLKVKIKPERENFKTPVKGSEGAACYDAYASEIEFHRDMIIIKLGFSTEFPKGWRADLIPRSNLTKYPFVMVNSPGCIDADFRNEWQFRLQYKNDISELQSYGFWYERNFPYKVGDRVCQFRFEKVNDAEFEIVENTSLTERGLGGFGHTGLK